MFYFAELSHAFLILSLSDKLLRYLLLSLNLRSIYRMAPILNPRKQGASIGLQLQAHRFCKTVPQRFASAVKFRVLQGDIRADIDKTTCIPPLLLGISCAVTLQPGFIIPEFVMPDAFGKCQCAKKLMLY
jgi:hypothetical protein